MRERKVYVNEAALKQKTKKLCAAQMLVLQTHVLLRRAMPTRRLADSQDRM